MITGLLFVQAVAFAVLSGIVASNKNRDPAGWGILGFLFGLFGFIAALVVEKVEPENGETEKKQSSEKSSRQLTTTRKFDPDEHEKKCPDCAEYIKLEARVCRYCGHEFSEGKVEQQIVEVKKEIEGQQREEEKERTQTEKTETDEKTPATEGNRKGLTDNEALAALIFVILLIVVFSIVLFIPS